MKIKKMLSSILGSILICSTLVGCGNTKQNVNIVKEDVSGSVATYTVYQPDNNFKKEDIQKVMEQIVEEKGKDKNGILVYFYEYENEANFKDIVPYVVGSWCPESGFNNAAQQVSSKNNKIRVEFSSKNEVTINEEKENLYKTMLSEFKDSKSTFYASVRDYAVANSKSIQEKHNMDLKTFVLDLGEMSLRYKDDAITKIKTGK